MLMKRQDQSTQAGSGVHRTGGLPGFIVFIDAECTFCNNSASFMLRHDPQQCIHIAALQGDTAARLLPELGMDADYIRSIRNDNAALDGIVCVLGAGTPRARLYHRSRAARLIATKMGFPWNLLGWLSWWIPDALLDPLYGVVKRNRHRLTGKACALPPLALRSRYLD